MRNKTNASEVCIAEMGIKMKERESGFSVVNLSWKAGKNGPFILENLNFTLVPGHFYGILGPNGSGKTSLLRHLLRLLDSKKAIELNKEALEKWKQRDLAKELSYVPQNTAVEADFTAEEIVLMGRAPYLGRFEAPGKEDKAAVKEAMELTGCTAFCKKSVLALSGGELQRVVAARAIAQGAKWIFLDEPVSHLDIKYQIDLMRIMERLCKEKEITIITVLHDINLAIRYCDRLICMKDGKLVCAGETEAIAQKGQLENIYGLRFEEIRTENGRRYLVPC